MARNINYEKKISELKERIGKREEELKVLKADLKSMTDEYSKQKNAELLDLLDQRNISPEQAVEIIRRATEGQMM